MGNKKLKGRSLSAVLPIYKFKNENTITNISGNELCVPETNDDLVLRNIRLERVSQ